MGMDGGVTITKICDIKKNWTTIRETLIRHLGFDENKVREYEIEGLTKDLEEAKKLPLNIDEHTGEDIEKMFSFLASCDCPYLLDDWLITAEGDNVPDSMNSLSVALGGISIETWT